MQNFNNFLNINANNKKKIFYNSIVKTKRLKVWHLKN